MASDQIPAVVPVWKEEGHSTHHLAQLLAQEYGVPTAHTGILDPLASGVVVVLLGEERFKKEEYTAGKKVYEVTALVGLSTDTHDLMGMVAAQRHVCCVSTAVVSETLASFVGEQEQMPPVFSAQMYQGKRLFQHAKDGSLDAIDVRARPIMVYEVALIEEGSVSVAVLEERIRSSIGRVRGEFRQKEILAQWPQYLRGEEVYQTITLRVVTGRGAYVRGLIRDVGERLGIPLVTYSLVRTENAGYTRDDCITLPMPRSAVPVPSDPVD